MRLIMHCPEIRAFKLNKIFLKHYLNNFRLGLSVAVIVIAVQTKHVGILETIEKCFKYCVH